MAIICFDFGGTAVKYGCYSQQVLVDKGVFKTPSSWQEMKSELKKIYDHYDCHQAQYGGIEGVAISAPGSVDSSKGVIEGISAIPYIHHFPIVTELEDWFSKPVAIENDANCAALAEMSAGSAKDAQTAAFFIIGSGIGGAICINRKLVKGAHLFGGEFGYLLANKTHTVSETATPVALARAYATEKKIETAFSGKDLFRLSDTGDHDAQVKVDQFYETIARTMHTVSLVIDPEVIVIGGGISARKEILKPLETRLNELLKITKAQGLDVSVKLAEFGQDANLIGAVAHFKQTMSKS